MRKLSLAEEAAPLPLLVLGRGATRASVDDAPGTPLVSCCCVALEADDDDDDAGPWPMVYARTSGFDVM